MLSTSSKQLLRGRCVVGPEDGTLDLTKVGFCEASAMKRDKMEGFEGVGKDRNVIVSGYGEQGNIVIHLFFPFPCIFCKLEVGAKSLIRFN